MRGEKYREISRGLGISISAVQKHVKKVYGKLGVHSRLELLNRYVIDQILTWRDYETDPEGGIIMYS